MKNVKEFYYEFLHKTVCKVTDQEKAQFAIIFYFNVHIKGTYNTTSTFTSAFASFQIKSQSYGRLASVLPLCLYLDFL